MTQFGAARDASSPDRLNGWKEIAAFLGKGVRTVQRWERDYGLPVHRLGREGGEIVFANRSELDRWMRENAQRAKESDRAKKAARAAPLLDLAGAPDPASPAALHGLPPPDADRSRRTGWTRWMVTAGLLTAAVAAPVLWMLSQPPASWRMAQGTLHVSNRLGWEIWSHRFFDGLPVQSSDDAAERVSGGHVVLKDLDGDGSLEVLVCAFATDRNAEAAFYIFNHDGTTRKVVRPSARVTYGDGPYAAPWLPYRVFVQGESVFVVFVHGQEYPTLLVELDAQGNTISEYWSDGYIETVVRGRWNGRDVLFVGAANNETRGSSLAIFDGGHARGSAPSEKPGYRCLDCPAGGPMEFLVFPQRCIARLDDGAGTVSEVWAEPSGRLFVQAAEGPPDVEGRRSAAVSYRLAPDLTVTRAELTTALRRLHDALQQQGRLNHDLAGDGEASLFPVRRWDLTKWTNLPVAIDR